MISHPGRWMPAAMRKSARHSRGRGVLVGDLPWSWRTCISSKLLLENLYITPKPLQPAAAWMPAIVRMRVSGTVHVTLGGESAPRHLPQCALGRSVTGHGALLDIFPHPSKLYPSEGEWARVRLGVGSPDSEVWIVQTGQGGPRSPQMAQSAEGNCVPQA